MIFRYIRWVSFCALSGPVLAVQAPVEFLSISTNISNCAARVSEVGDTLPSHLRSTDLYEILKIHKGASSQEIKKAYRALAKEWYPRSPGAVSLEHLHFQETAFRIINEAYQVLSDSGKRAEYDRTGRISKKSSESPNSSRFFTAEQWMAMRAFDFTFSSEVEDFYARAMSSNALWGRDLIDQLILKARGNALANIFRLGLDREPQVHQKIIQTYQSLQSSLIYFSKSQADSELRNYFFRLFVLRPTDSDFKQIVFSEISDLSRDEKLKQMFYEEAPRVFEYDRDYEAKLHRLFTAIHLDSKSAIYLETALGSFISYRKFSEPEVLKFMESLSLQAWSDSLKIRILAMRVGASRAPDPEAIRMATSLYSKIQQEARESPAVLAMVKRLTEWGWPLGRYIRASI